MNELKNNKNEINNKLKIFFWDSINKIILTVLLSLWINWIANSGDEKYRILGCEYADKVKDTLLSSVLDCEDILLVKSRYLDFEKTLKYSVPTETNPYSFDHKE